MIRTYSELITLSTFEERYRYLRLGGKVGKETFGFDRYLNQVFYKDPEWLSVRDDVIIRDKACDLGMLQACEALQQLKKMKVAMPPITQRRGLYVHDY